MNKAMAAHLDALGYAPEMLFQFWSLLLLHAMSYGVAKSDIVTHG